MSSNAIKQRVERAVHADLKAALEANPSFDKVNFFYRQTNQTYTHPSVLVACENAPLLTSAPLIYEAKIDLYITSIAVFVDEDGAAKPDDFHVDRVGLVEDWLFEVEASDPDEPTLKTRLNAQDVFPLLILDVEFAEPESFQSEKHWVDKQTFHVFCQQKIVES